MSRLNFTKLGKHCLKPFVVRASRQALDKEVEETALRGFRALGSSLMGQNLDLLSVQLEDFGLGEGHCGGLFALKLNVSKATRFAVGEKFQLAGSNRTELHEGFVQLLLSHSSVNRLDNQIRFGLHEVALLKVAADEVVSNARVVEFLSATARLGNIEELEETIAVLALGLLINVDDCLVDIEA